MNQSIDTFLSALFDSIELRLDLLHEFYISLFL